MLSTTQIGTVAKFTPKQKATMLAISHVPWTGLVVDSYNYRMWGAYAASGDVNISTRNLLTVESVFG